MKTEKIIVSDLFEKPRRYLVPLFQRGYVWTKDGQWAPLWEDVLNLVKALRRQRSLEMQQLRKHFLGAIVLQQQSLGVRHVPVSDVIDGQQRIMTLQLFLIALRDTVANLGSAFLTATLDRLTQNPGPYVNDSERFKVWPTSVYQEDFQALSFAGSAAEVESHFPVYHYRRRIVPRPQLVEAYLFFCDQIQKYLRNDADQSDAEEGTGGDRAVEDQVQLAEDLLEAVVRQVHMVEINLDAEDDPQIIFETLNARGVPLAPSDLIRNFIFLYATRRQENVVDLHEKYWKPFDETPDSDRRNRTKRYWKGEERQGRFKTNRLDLFFYHYLTYKTESDLQIGHIFQAFKDWWDSGEVARSAGEELVVIAETAEVYRRLISIDRESRLGKLASTLRIIDTTTTFPVVFYLESQRENVGDQEVDSIYDDLESYLVRRLICDLTAKNYNRVFLSLLKNLRAQGIVTRASAQAYLLSLEGESGVWPDDDTLRKNFVFEGLYSKLRAGRVQMILQAIEQALASTFQETLSIDSYLSVEHVWPQNPQESAWPPLPEREDGSFDWEALMVRQKIVNSIGNLTLVTPSFNSSLSNRSFQEKRPALVKESRLRLNAYFQDLGSHNWTEEDIIRRGENLFEYARKVWRRP
jgi:uncharacterized protein with ParB-like and HNH nuclease domain